MALTEYRREIEAAAKEHGIDPDVLEGVVLTESSGKADAFRFEPGYYRLYMQGKPEWAGQVPRRIASSYGLCQVMYGTARQYGYKGEPEGLFQIPVNLHLGAKILAALLKRFGGNVEKALQAYNAGPGNVGSAQARAYSTKAIVNIERVRAGR